MNDFKLKSLDRYIDSLDTNENMNYLSESLDTNENMTYLSESLDTKLESLDPNKKSQSHLTGR